MKYTQSLPNITYYGKQDGFYALDKAKEKQVPCIAMDMNGTIITGKESNLLSAPSALIINAIKHLSKIPDNIDLLSPTILEPILNLRTNKKRVPLQLQEVLIALSICSVTNPTVGDALKQLKKCRSAYTEFWICRGFCLRHCLQPL